jgi:hypothetical protein
MYWFRINRRWAAHGALLALLIQLVASFGHLHLGDLTGPASSASAIGVANHAAVLRPTPAPAHGNDGTADPSCPVCALIQLASTAVPPAPPPLPLPAAFDRIRWEAAAASASALAAPRFFQARAPPSA